MAGLGNYTTKDNIGKSLIIVCLKKKIPLHSVCVCVFVCGLKYLNVMFRICPVGVKGSNWNTVGLFSRMKM